MIQIMHDFPFIEMFFELQKNNSGKRTGVGYVLYDSVETAAAAIENLTGTNVSQRQLRFMFSDKQQYDWARRTLHGPPIIGPATGNPGIGVPGKLPPSKDAPPEGLRSGPPGGPPGGLHGGPFGGPPGGPRGEQSKEHDDAGGGKSGGQQSKPDADTKSSGSRPAQDNKQGGKDEPKPKEDATKNQSKQEEAAQKTSPTEATKKPDTTSKKSDSTPSKPEPTPKKSDSTPSKPDSTPKKPDSTPKGKPEPAASPAEKKPPARSANGHVCVHISGLPPTVTESMVVDFFSDVGLLPQQLHLLLDEFQNPSGEAFCEFANTGEAERALTKDKQFLGTAELTVNPVSKAEVRATIGADPGHEHASEEYNGEEGDGYGYGYEDDMGYPQHRGGYAPRGRGNPYGGGPGHGGYQDRGRGRGRGGYGRGGGGGGGGGPTDGFGRQGCVLSVTNIPFRASADDILYFFGEFSVRPDQVIRRYNEHGLPSSEARVAFNSGGEAMAAMKRLNRRPMLNRPIYLELI